MARLIGDRLVPAPRPRAGPRRDVRHGPAGTARAASAGHRHGGLHRSATSRFGPLPVARAGWPTTTSSPSSRITPQLVGGDRRRRPDPVERREALHLDDGARAAQQRDLDPRRDPRRGHLGGDAPRPGADLCRPCDELRQRRRLSAQRHPRHPRGSARQPVDRQQPTRPLAAAGQRGEALRQGQRRAVVEQHHGAAREPRRRAVDRDDGRRPHPPVARPLHQLLDRAGAAQQRRHRHPLRGAARLGRHHRRQLAPGAQRPGARPAHQGRRLERPCLADPRRWPGIDLDERRARHHPLERSDLLKVANGNVEAATPGSTTSATASGAGIPGRVAVVGRASRRRIAGVPECDRRRHRPQRRRSPVDRRAVREGDGSAGRGHPIPSTTGASAAGRRQAARSPLHRDQPGGAEPVLFKTSWKGRTPAWSRPVRVAPLSTRTCAAAATASR